MLEHVKLQKPYFEFMVDNASHQQGVLKVVWLHFLKALMTPLHTISDVYHCVCLCRCDQSFALVGDRVFMFGGYEESGDFCKDLHVLNTGKHRFLSCI